MLDRFRTHLADSQLIPPGSRVLVGYSGGADSTALLHLLAKSGVDCVAAHLHHGQREEAESELENCRSFADQLGVPFAAGRANVPLMAEEMGIGLEEAGRKARYSFFTEASFRLSCDLIATAHTRSDQVETILFNLARGTGIHGLGGIPERRDNIVRPLLPFSREETQSYCQQNQFWTHDDPANGDLNFSRARIRHRVIGELRQINPAFDQSIIRLSAIAREEDEFLNGMAASALEQSEVDINGDLKFLTEDVEIRMDRARLAHFPPPLIKRGIRLATEVLGGALDYEQTHIVYTNLVEGTKGSVSSEGGEVVVEWDDKVVDFRRLSVSTPFRHTLTIPGETMSDEFGWQIDADLTPPPTTRPSRGDMETWLDADKVHGALYFRSAKQGDVMQPLGFHGRRKLSDILSEAKLTIAARSRIPIVCDMVGPLWIPGICLGERAAPNADTTRAFHLRFGPIRG